jgi:hypothetical protein
VTQGLISRVEYRDYPALLTVTMSGRVSGRPAGFHKNRAVSGSLAAYKNLACEFDIGDARVSLQGERGLF